MKALHEYISPGFAARLDRFLLVHYPHIWHKRIHVWLLDILLIDLVVLLLLSMLPSPAGYILSAVPLVHALWTLLRLSSMENHFIPWREYIMLSAGCWLYMLLVLLPLSVELRAFYSDQVLRIVSYVLLGYVFLCHLFYFTTWATTISAAFYGYFIVPFALFAVILPFFYIHLALKNFSLGLADVVTFLLVLMLGIAGRKLYYRLQKGIPNFLHSFTLGTYLLLTVGGFILLNQSAIIENATTLLFLGLILIFGIGHSWVVRNFILIQGLPKIKTRSAVRLMPSWGVMILSRYVTPLLYSDRLDHFFSWKAPVLWAKKTAYLLVIACLMLTGTLLMILFPDLPTKLIRLSSILPEDLDSLFPIDVITFLVFTFMLILGFTSAQRNRAPNLAIYSRGQSYSAFFVLWLVLLLVFSSSFLCYYAFPLGKGRQWDKQSLFADVLIIETVSAQWQLDQDYSLQPEASNLVESNQAEIQRRSIANLTEQEMIDRLVEVARKYNIPLYDLDQRNGATQKKALQSITESIRRAVEYRIHKATNYDAHMAWIIFISFFPLLSTLALSLFLEMTENYRGGFGMLPFHIGLLLCFLFIPLGNEFSLPGDKASWFHAYRLTIYLCPVLLIGLLITKMRRLVRWAILSYNAAMCSVFLLLCYAGISYTSSLLVIQTAGGFLPVSLIMVLMSAGIMVTVHHLAGRYIIASPYA